MPIPRETISRRLPVHPMNTVTVTAIDGSLSVTTLQGNTPPVLSGGFGGWSIISRPRMVGVTQWDGKDPFQMEISLMFDGLSDRIPQDVEIAKIIRLGSPPLAGLRPSPVRVTGAVPRRDITWVINDLRFLTENEIWDVVGGVGVRLRQEVNVTLLQFVDADTQEFIGYAHPTRPGIYIFKQGDSLQSIAARFLGSSKRWNEIRQLNDIRDPQAIKPNTPLRIPQT